MRISKMRKSPIVIGVAGGIGSGKSSVARILAAHGCLPIIADNIAHDVLKSRGFRQMVAVRIPQLRKALFSRLYRREVARIVFNDAALLRRLENIIHPVVRRIIKKKLQTARRRYVVLDVPLLFESKLDKLCNYIIFINVPLEVRTRRLSKSSLVETLLLREKLQAPLSHKRRNSDFVIRNSGSLEQLEKDVLDLFHKIKLSGGTHDNQKD